MSVLNSPLRRIISGMSDKKNKANGGKKKYKPYRAVRIPERLAQFMEELAKEDFNTISDQVREAVRERAIARGKLPRPS